MKSIASWFLTLLTLAALSEVTLPRAQADFQGDVLQGALEAPAPPHFPGPASLPRVDRLEQLDLTRPLTADDLGQIESFLLHTFGQEAWIQPAMPQILGSVHSMASQPSVNNVVFYAGVEAGLALGGAANIVVIFGKDTATDRLAFHVAPLLRAHLFQLGYGIILGIGSIQGATPGISAGLMVGLALGYGLGAGYGVSIASDTPQTWWLEIKMGTVYQGGVFIEAVL